MYVMGSPIMHENIHFTLFAKKLHPAEMCDRHLFTLYFVKYFEVQRQMHTRAHEIKQIPTGIAGLIDMVKITSFGLVSFDLVPISRRTMFSKLGFFRLRFQHSEGTKSQK